MLVNQEGEIVIQNDTQPPKGESNSIGSGESMPSNGVIDEPQPLSKEHEAFINYNKRIRKIAVLPKPSDEDFCRKMKEFIETRGDGMASSDQLIEAYNLFQSTCIEKKKDDVEEQSEKSQQSEVEKDEIQSQESPTASHSDTDTVQDPTPAISDEYRHRDSKLTTFDDDLGIRPSTNKVIKKIPELQEKTNNNSLLFFLVILGVATMVYAINKKD